MADRWPGISDTELDVLKALWERSAGTVREILTDLRAQGKQWAYTTVQTLLHRLEEKKFVACDRKDATHVFRAIVTRDQLLQRRLSDLSTQLCEGTASPLVLALVEGVRMTPKEIEQLRKLLDEMEKE